MPGGSTAQILQEGFVHLVVGQWFLALIADQIKEAKGEPLLKQIQAARAGPGRGICGPGLQFCAEDLPIALRQKLNGVFGPPGSRRPGPDQRLSAPQRFQQVRETRDQGGGSER
jgi:hypothetical protein